MNNAPTPRLITTEALFAKVKEAIRSLPFTPGMTALDAPAGAGALTKFLHEELGYAVTAADIDPGKWEYPPVAIEKADLGRPLPYADATFDLTVCQEGLKHLTDCPTAIAELARVTKPGGHLIATVPNDLALQVRLRYLFTGFVDVDRKTPQDPSSDDEKESLHMQSSLQLPLLYYLFEKNGLELIETSTSRLRTGSVILAALLYLPIWILTARAARPGTRLSRELLSLTWLAGRHNVMIARKKRKRA